MEMLNMFAVLSALAMILAGSQVLKLELRRMYKK